VLPSLLATAHLLLLLQEAWLPLSSLLPLQLLVLLAGSVVVPRCPWPLLGA
jgi:hypothetical protein